MARLSWGSTDDTVGLKKGVRTMGWQAEPEWRSIESNKDSHRGVFLVPHCLGTDVPQHRHRRRCDACAL
jgi:hypothetical protein